MGKALMVGLVLVSSVAVSGALVPLTRIFARRVGVLDHPGKRKVHSVPTPRLGGVAVFLAFSAVVLTGYLVAPSLSGQAWARASFGSALALLQEAYRVEAKLRAVLAGGVLVFGVGLADDVFGRRFPVGAKAAGQVLAALILTEADVRVSFLPYGWMNATVSVLWLVGITNAFNLLDNMDGLSAGVAFVASGILLLNAWTLGEFFISLILVAFMGSLLGFLFFNFHPASVFLGDCGSLFIGFTMGSLTLLERYISHASSALFPVLMPVVVLAVPLTDTATVIVIRLREGRPIYVGDSRHLSHRLVSIGFSKREAVLMIYLITFCLGLSAASLTDASGLQAFLIILQSLGFVALVLTLMFFDRRPAPGDTGT